MIRKARQLTYFFTRPALERAPREVGSVLYVTQTKSLNPDSLWPKVHSIAYDLAWESGRQRTVTYGVRDIRDPSASEGQP